jgi:hypothetical protein
LIRAFRQPFLPVAIAAQTVRGRFSFALDYLVDQELNFTTMGAQLKNNSLVHSGFTSA